MLEELDHVGQMSDWAEVRKCARYRYRVRDGILLRPSGSKVDFLVRPRNISTYGVSVLHGAFLHPGTECVLCLRTRSGDSVMVWAKLLRCRCVQGRTHELSLLFTKPIEIEKFVVVEPAGTDSAPQPVATDAAPTSGDPAAALAARIEQVLVADTKREEDLVAALRECLTALRGTHPIERP